MWQNKPIKSINAAEATFLLTLYLFIFFIIIIIFFIFQHGSSRHVPKCIGV